MNKSETFASRLNQLLQLRGLTKAELSRKTGISRSSITHYAKGDWEGKQDAVYAIADATGVNEAWLMGYDVPLYKEERKPPLQTPETTGQRIKATRESAGMSREELAAALGVSCADIEKWEWDICVPRYPIQEKIATTLNVPIKSIYKGTIFDKKLEEMDPILKSALIISGEDPKLYDKFRQHEAIDEATPFILSALTALNINGIKEAIKRVEELTEIPRYRADTPQHSRRLPQIPEPSAPENDPDGPEMG